MDPNIIVGGLIALVAIIVVAAVITAVVQRKRRAKPVQTSKPWTPTDVPRDTAPARATDPLPGNASGTLPEQRSERGPRFIAPAGRWPGDPEATSHQHRPASGPPRRKIVPPTVHRSGKHTLGDDRVADEDDTGAYPFPGFISYPDADINSVRTNDTELIDATRNEQVVNTGSTKADVPEPAPQSYNEQPASPDPSPAPTNDSPSPTSNPE